MLLGENERAYIKFRAVEEAKSRPKEPYVYQLMTGYIYIVHCIGFPYYKIGWTTLNPKARLDALQTSIPFELELEYAIKVEDILEVEHIIHKRHTDKQIRGEWFMLNDEELDDIKGEIVLLELAKDSHPISQELWNAQRIH